MVTVEKLYQNFGVLADAKDKAGEHEKEFQEILEGVKGGPGEKRLASQFVARFFKYFPTLAEEAINAQLDLCEDEDIMIRKQAIKDLPALCKDNVAHVGRLSDVLTQLLQSEDAGEISLVQSSLLALLRLDMKAALNGMFTQINSGEDVVRERAIKFLSTKMKSSVAEDLFTKEVEDFIVEESKKVLQDVTGDEFVSFMKLLSSLKTMATLQGRQQLVEIVADQADMDKEFEASDPDNVDRLVHCIREALPFFSKNVQSTKFVAYLCDNVLPVLGQIHSAEENGEKEGSSPEVDIQLDILKLLAELSAHTGELEDAQTKIDKLYTKLLDYMPLPPEEGEGENTTPDTEPKLHFSYVECLMFAFHQLGRKSPEFLTGEDNAERLKDFRIRLQYFARGVQMYIKQLRMALQGKTGDALKTDENKIKAVALKITSNINTLIKDLFHNPPAYKATINLSWKPLARATPATATSPGQKRPGITPITFDSSSKTPKASRPIYAPPEGKYSEKAGTYTGGFRGNRGRGRGFRGGRGQNRGRGRGRGYYWN